MSGFILFGFFVYFVLFFVVVLFFVWLFCLFWGLLGVCLFVFGCPFFPFPGREAANMVAECKGNPVCCSFRYTGEQQ